MPPPYSALDWPAAGFRGTNLTAAPDQLLPGQVTLAQNISTSISGQISTRPGTVMVGPNLATLTSGAPIHTVAYLSDPVSTYPTKLTLWAVGAGTNLWGWDGSASAWFPLASGFSGNPLTTVIYRLSGTGQPWLIVADSLKMIKIAYVDGAWTVYQLGITPDPDPSTAVVLGNTSYVISYPTPADGAITVTGAASTGQDTAALSTIVRANGGVTATSGSTNDYIAGLPVEISASGSPSFDGQFLISDIASSTEFTYPQPGPGASASGTLSAAVGYTATATTSTSVIYRKTQSLNLATINGNPSPITDTIQAYIYISDTTKVIDVDLFFDLDSASTGASKYNYMSVSILPQLSNGWNLVSVPKSSFTTYLNGGTTIRPANATDFANIFGWDVYFLTKLSDAPSYGIAAIFMQVAFGPDSSVGLGYDYRDTYYDSVTQSESNPSPVMAMDVYPVNQGVGLVPGSPSADPQVNEIRWWRRGGTLTSNWYLVGVQKNLPIATISTATTNSAATVATITTAAPHGFAANDVVYIAGVSNAAFDGFFTIATVPSPTTFTVSNTVAGSSTSATGGTAQEAFIDSLPDSAIATAPILSLQNDVPVTTVDIAGMIVYGQPIPYIWGPYGGTTIFGCGDPNQPGNLYWSNPSSPDEWGNLNFVEVTQPSDPLTLGVYWQGNPWARSMESVYQIIPAAIPGFYSITDVGSGESVASPWALLGGSNIPFMPWVGKSGIFISTGGQGQSITDETLWPLFDPNSTRTDAIDWTFPQWNRLSYFDHHLRWVYQGKDGIKRLYKYNISRSYWDGPSAYAFGGTLEFNQPEVEETLLIGGSDGNLYSWDTATTTDNGTAISALVQTQVFKPAGFEDDCEWGHINTDGQSPVSGISIFASFNANLSGYIAIGNAINTVRGVTPFSMQDQYSNGMSLQFSWQGPGTLFGFSVLWRNDGQAIIHCETPATSFGATHFSHAYKASVALRSTATVNCTIVVDNVPLAAQPIPSTSNTRLRQDIYFPLNKGNLFQVKLDGGPFRVYPEECSLEMMPWDAVQVNEVKLPFTGGFASG